MAAKPIPPLSEARSPKVTPTEAKAIAQEAFVFGLPLVYIGLSIDAETNVAKPEGLRAPINQFGHVREFPDAKANPIVGMNVDTLYSVAHLDLAAEPMVISIPEMGTRWWIMQLIDTWNDVPAAPGFRTVGGRGGNFRSRPMASVDSRRSSASTVRRRHCSTKPGCCQISKK